MPSAHEHNTILESLQFFIVRYLTMVIQVASILTGESGMTNVVRLYHAKSECRILPLWYNTAVNIW